MPPIDLVYLFVQDMDRAVGFYGTTLGLRLHVRAGNDWAQFETGTIALGLHGVRPGEPMEPGGTIGFTVDDLDVAVTGLRAKGVAIDHEGGGDDGRQRFATFTDPDGNVLAYFEASEPKEAHR
jgi:catechol 2,3-dioxygenase-like lactoylglutathione lyase family enzyme